MRIAVVIVVFDRPERLKKHLSILRGQTRPPDGVIVVNNGKGSVDWAVAECKGRFPVEIIRVDNAGPAGGFRAGAMKAYEEGYDYIIFADDDAYLTDKRALGYFEEDAAAGREIAGVYYTNGRSASLANHYFMVGREIFAKVGFHFAPFYLMWEDVEFMERAATAAGMFYDPRIVIDHPMRAFLEPEREYYVLRNGFVRAAVNGSITGCLMLFSHRLLVLLFIALFLGERASLRNFLVAMAHFASGKLGRQEVGNAVQESVETGIEEPGKGGRPIFISTWLGKDEPVLISEDIAEVVGRGREAHYRKERSVHGNPLGIIRLMRLLAGRNVVVGGVGDIAYPPFSALAKAVYVYDEGTGKIRLLYRNNPLLALAFMALAAPLIVAALPAAAALFLLKQTYYVKLFAAEIAEDREFCRRYRK